MSGIVGNSEDTFYRVVAHDDDVYTNFYITDSPYFIIVQIIFSGPMGSMSSCLFVLNIQYCLSRR